MKMMKPFNQLRHLGAGFYCPYGGYFTWVELPSLLGNIQVFKQAQKQELSFHPSFRFILSQT